MRTNPLVLSAVLFFTACCGQEVRAQFAPADLQEAVDASFGPWDPQNTDALGTGYPNLWSNQSVLTLDGVDAARVAAPSTPYLGIVRLRAMVAGPATLHFSYLCAPRYSGGPAGGASVQAGSATQLPLPAARFWQEGSVTVGPGGQLVTWGFATGQFIAGESGPAYLDQVWTEDDPRPRVTSAAIVEGQKGLAVSYQITTNKPCDSYAATGVPPGMSVNPQTGLISGTPTELGSFDARVKASNDAGSHTRSVLFRVLTPSPASATDLTVALDAVGSAWSQETDGFSEAWSGVFTGHARDEVDAATVPLRTAPEPDTSSHWLTTEVLGPGTLSFWHRAVRFPNAAGESLAPAGTVPLTTRVDGTANFAILAGAISSEWGHASMRVPTGRHQFGFLVSTNGFEGSGGPDGDVLVVFDQASFAQEPQSFTIGEWLGTVVGNPGIDPTQDTDGDGLALLMEYALGGSPASNDAALLPEVAITNEHLTMTVHKSPGTSGVEYTVQRSTSLAMDSWTTSGLEIRREDTNILVVRCAKPVAEEPRHMLRLRIRLDDPVGP